MSKVPVTLRADQSVQDAMALLYANGITGAPVINESLQVVGVVSNFDFLWEEAFEGSLLPIDGDAQHVAAYAKAARKICAKTVQEAMSDNDLYTVTPTTTMKHAAELMTKVKLHHLPVIDDRNGDKLVGILTSSDVMQDLLRESRAAGLPMISMNSLISLTLTLELSRLPQTLYAICLRPSRKRLTKRRNHCHLSSVMENKTSRTQQTEAQFPSTLLLQTHLSSKAHLI